MIARAERSDSRPPRRFEQQRGRGVGVRPAGAFGQPRREGGAQFGAGQRELAQLAAVAAFPAHPQGAFACRQRDVGEVETDDLPDPQPGVEGQQRDDGIAGRPAVLHRPQVHLPIDESFRSAPRQRLASGGRGAQAAAGVEVVDGREGVVDRCRGLAADGLGPHPPVPYCAVPSGRVGERIPTAGRAVGGVVGGGQPDQEPADPRDVLGPGRPGQRGTCQGALVPGELGRELYRHRDHSAGPVGGTVRIIGVSGS